MDNSKQATLELGTKPVGKLLMQYALPAIAAMTAASLYNMTDSIFIGQGCGALAISGLAITFPLQNLGAAFGAGVGVGASTCISVKLGQKDYQTAERVFGNAVTLNLIIGIAFSIITLLFLNPILKFFGASDATLPYAREYMVVTLAGNVISRSAMMASIMTVVLNAILSPIFIWPLHMGIRGAALATIIAQFCVLMWQLRIFSNPQCIVHFKRGIYRPVKHIIKNIIAIGMSPFAMNVCSCIIIIFINNALTHHGGDQVFGLCVDQAAEQGTEHAAREGHQAAQTQDIAEQRGHKGHAHAPPRAKQHGAGHVDHVLDGCAFAAEHGEAEHAAHHAQSAQHTGQRQLFHREIFHKVRLLSPAGAAKPYSAPANSPHRTVQARSTSGRDFLVSSHAGTRLPIADDSRHSGRSPSVRCGSPPAERYKASSSEQ